MSWERAVDVALTWLGLRTEPWRRLLLAAGPTPKTGPLTHDLLVPGEKVGLNVFPHGRALGFRAELVNVSQEAATLLDLTGVDWAGGVAIGPDGPRLKLYAVEGIAGVPGPPDPPGAIAVGIDVVRGQFVRRRTYHPPELVDLGAWPQLTWPGPVVGESHRLVTVLGDEKRTLNILFRPDATLAHLAALCPIHRYLALANDIKSAGFLLRPAAWELDGFADGRTATDVLLTIGER